MTPCSLDSFATSFLSLMFVYLIIKLYFCGIK
nr:MAG TPA: small hydrophobic protein [Caudoviricetes sp.]